MTEAGESFYNVPSANYECQNKIVINLECII
jgi:hypothetical protein